MKDFVAKNFESPEQGPILVYYFAFPHYRISVLRELKEKLGDKLVLVSGSTSRGGVKTLTNQQLQELTVLPSFRIGPFTWERKIVKKAMSNHFSTVVIAPAITSLSTWAILCGRRFLNRQTFLWGQCGKPGDRSFKRILQEMMNRMATGLLVYGSLEESGALELGTPQAKVKRVLNAVPLDAVELSATTLSTQLKKSTRDALDRETLRLVYVGRINPDKNIEVLLKSGELLKKKFSKLSIRIIGEGPDMEPLRNKYSDPRYEFVGAIYDKNILKKELLEATLIVSPSTMGLLALDALSVGVPVMVPDHPRNGSEVEALTPDINGFSFKHDDPDDLAIQVEEALEKLSKLDMDLYYSSRQQGIRNWSPEGVAQNICNVIAPSQEN